ncbi:MAG: DUF4383 domain-containing protein [Xanthomonadales bacterium]|nr:DUF4383 domain-containing protein [Xanthomonadales bacterium]
MDTRIASIVMGFAFVATGLLGFVPNPLVAPDGLFAVNAAHNAVHLLTGTLFLLVPVLFAGREGRAITAIGVAYAAVAVLGFFTRGDMLLGLVHINQADRWLHAGLALVILAAGRLLPQAPPPAAREG